MYGFEPVCWFWDTSTNVSAAGSLLDDGDVTDASTSGGSQGNNSGGGSAPPPSADTAIGSPPVIGPPRPFASAPGPPDVTPWWLTSMFVTQPSTISSMGPGRLPIEVPWQLGSRFSRSASDCSTKWPHKFGHDAWRPVRPLTAPPSSSATRRGRLAASPPRTGVRRRTDSVQPERKRGFSTPQEPLSAMLPKAAAGGCRGGDEGAGCSATPGCSPAAVSAEATSMTAAERPCSAARRRNARSSSALAPAFDIVVAPAQRRASRAPGTKMA